jgi:hypothetical protein
MVSGPATRLDHAALARLSPRAGGTGLLLGRDPDRVPVVVPLLRPEPTRVLLIGGAWLARLVAFRCLALGARVLVRTTEPQRWNGLDANRVTVVPRPEPVTGHLGEPVLHVADLGGRDGGDLAPDAAWQTLLTVADQLTGPAAAALATADAVLVQRMWAQQAAYVASVLRVAPASVPAIEALPDDSAVLLRAGTYRQLWLGPTALERRLVGPAQRA